MDKRKEIVEKYLAELQTKDKQMHILCWERTTLEALRRVDKNDFSESSRLAMKYAIYSAAKNVEAVISAIRNDKINGMADLKLIIDQRIREAEEVLVEDY